MRTLLIPIFLGWACIVLLTACGTNQSVVSGDFSQFGDDAAGITLKLGYYSRTIGEEVVLGSTPLKNGTVEMKFSYDEEIPRVGFMSLTSGTPQQFQSVYKQVIIDKATHYVIELYDPPDLWFRVTSDGIYSDLIEFDIEHELAYRNKFKKLMELTEQLDALVNDPSQNNNESTNNQDRVPSVHAEILDWANMECSDYAGEFESFWDRETSWEHQESEEVQTVLDEILELRQELAELSERFFERSSQRFREKLTNSSDPIEQLLIFHLNGYDLGLDASIALLEKLKKELPVDIVEEHISIPLSSMSNTLERQQASDSLKLGSLIPSFQLELKDTKSVSISTLLQDNQVVVLEFWDNHCAWCIEAMEEYVEFYDEFEDLGFEVVSVSFESERDDWVTKIDELNYPWVNTIAPGGFDGKIGKEFGVQHTRQNFVLNSDGCIMKRNLDPDELLDFLTARLRS